MTTDTIIRRQEPATGEHADPLYKSSQVSMILGQRWEIPCGRDLLASVSDYLGVATRSAPRGQRRWTMAEIEQVAEELHFRQTCELLARNSTVEALSKERDLPEVQRLRAAVAAMSEVPALRALFAQTAAA